MQGGRPWVPIMDHRPAPTIRRDGHERRRLAPRAFGQRDAKRGRAEAGGEYLQGAAGNGGGGYLGVGPAGLLQGSLCFAVDGAAQGGHPVQEFGVRLVLMRPGDRVVEKEKRQFKEGGRPGHRLRGVGTGQRQGGFPAVEQGLAPPCLLLDADAADQAAGLHGIVFNA